MIRHPRQVDRVHHRPPIPSNKYHNLSFIYMNLDIWISRTRISMYKMSVINLSDWWVQWNRNRILRQNKLACSVMFPVFTSSSVLTRRRIISMLDHKLLSISSCGQYFCWVLIFEHWTKMIPCRVKIVLTFEFRTSDIRYRHSHFIELYNITISLHFTPSKLAYRGCAEYI